MQEKHAVYFGPYRLDLSSIQLWRGEQIIPLPPKASVVLQYLVQRPQQLATKDELFAVGWPKVVVSDIALAVCIREIRKALGDNAKQPQFIQTVHRRGYRFIETVTECASDDTAPFSLGLRPRSRPPHFVGREVELSQLQNCWNVLLNGQRQFMFLTGEAGIGKTTLIDAWLTQVGHEGQSWVGRGQCIEQYGAGEAYMPVLEALGRLCRQPDGQPVIDLLRQQAPSWLVQMPALVDDRTHEALKRKTQGVTRARMLRELAEAMEVLTVQRPIIMVLEDLHWSDYSTLEFLASLARRRESARLLVIGTYRPVEAIVAEHPLRTVKQELVLHGQCEELSLAYLSVDAIAAYLADRFPHNTFPNSLAELVHVRTDGNPLFMVNVVDASMRQGVITRHGQEWQLSERGTSVGLTLPETLQQLIEQQIRQVSAEERRMLEAASIAGATFSAAAVAAGIGTQLETIEEQCETLARREQFISARGTAEWPDGTVAGQYTFIHAMYQEVLAERLTTRQQISLHQRIGERKEAGYGQRAREIAAELAVHFEQGRDYPRAVRYLQQAGENAIQRSADQEAVAHLTKGVALLKTLPETPERAQQELTLQLTLKEPLQNMKGYAASDVERVVVRAMELCQQVGETSQLFWARFGFTGVHMARAQYQAAYEVASQCQSLAERLSEPSLLLLSHKSQGACLRLLGDLALAQDHLERGIALYDPQLQPPMAFHKVYCQGELVQVLWYLGYLDQALAQSRATLTFARELSHPHSLAYGLFYVAQFSVECRQMQTAKELLEEVLRLSTEYGFPMLLGWAILLLGVVLAMQGQVEEGLAQMQQGLAVETDAGGSLARVTAAGALAGAYAATGQMEKGLALVAEGLERAHKVGMRITEARLYTSKGRLLLTQPPEHLPEAESCFQLALDIAQHHKAKLIELQAAMGLSRVWQQQGKKTEAHQLLAEVYGWFTEGFEMAELQEAKALLDKLEGRKDAMAIHEADPS